MSLPKTWTLLVTGRPHGLQSETLLYSKVKLCVTRSGDTTGPAQSASGKRKGASIPAALHRRSRMPWLASWILVLGWSFTMTVRGEVEITAARAPIAVFSGAGRRLGLTLHNTGAGTFVADLRARLYQATSATAAPLGFQPWKRVEVLPGQTILESAAFDFPLVRAETPFLIQWVAGSNQVVGLTEVQVYPPDLLRVLRALGRDEPVGSFDPLDQLKPLLKSAEVEYLDLQDAGLENFVGKLAIIGPFGSKSEMRSGLTSQVKALARRGVGTVWLQPPPEPRDRLVPSFYVVPEGKGAVVVVQAGLVSDLADNPQAQLNLVECSRLATHPESFNLPQSTPEP
jgi:hypothetical protein